MPFFNRKRKQTLTPVMGTLLCQARGCHNPTALQCSYIDKRGRACTGVFCPAHWGVVDGDVYCRRHASTMRALGEAASDRRGLPDVDNRGPSLVNWIADQLDSHLRQMLTDASHGDERILVEKDVKLAYDAHRRPRWERSWKLVESTGMVLKVGIQVDERDDAMVTVRVGSEMVAQGVPPWIARRHSGAEIDPDVDRLRRELFYRFLEENIQDAVRRMRLRVDSPTWVA